MPLEPAAIDTYLVAIESGYHILDYSVRGQIKLIIKSSDFILHCDTKQK